jgi:hypothetical protein
MFAWIGVKVSARPTFSWQGAVVAFIVSMTGLNRIISVLAVGESNLRDG